MDNIWSSQAFRGELPAGFQGNLSWQSPSNIALVKYWGKKGKQLPQNPSVSFTLSNCRTVTSVAYERSNEFHLDFRFEGKENPEFAVKIEKFLLDNLASFPFLTQLDLHMDSHNTFPHSSGIASSAASMSALVMCLLDLERHVSGVKDMDLRKASYFSRLASGSACRSVFPVMALWGKSSVTPDSSDEYAVSLEEKIHPLFKTYHDSILIVSDSAKAVSSRAGHALMEGNPYAEARYQQAKENTKTLFAALGSGDLDAFIRITESEAMQLHALMMCSNPSYVLLKPDTLNLIDEIRHFREETKIPVCFTLDAGPNVHLLYPDKDAEKVDAFIRNVLDTYCVGGQWIADQVGQGPQKLA